MGHQFPRAVAAAALALVASCGGDGDDTDPPSILDNARQQVADVGPLRGESEAVESTDVASGTPDELPTPDPSTFEGANRVANLWFGADGRTTAIDVWGRRTFSTGPILLASGIGFGEWSNYEAAPANYELSIVGTGAGPDGTELANVVNAVGVEHLTTVFTNSDRAGGGRSVSLWERGVEQTPMPPADGNGLLRVAAINLDAVDDALVRSIGVDSFSIGDGGGTCLSDRAGDGLGPAVLATTGRLDIEIAPGPASVTLHPPMSERCVGAALARLDLDITADSTTLVLVYSRDGTSIEMLAVPVR